MNFDEYINFVYVANMHFILPKPLPMRNYATRTHLRPRSCITQPVQVKKLNASEIKYRHILHRATVLASSVEISSEERRMHGQINNLFQFPQTCSINLADYNMSFLQRVQN